MPEKLGPIFLQNFCNDLPNYTASHPQGQCSSLSPLREPKISKFMLLVRCRPLPNMALNSNLLRGLSRLMLTAPVRPTSGFLLFSSISYSPVLHQFFLLMLLVLLLHPLLPILVLLFLYLFLLPLPFPPSPLFSFSLVSSSSPSSFITFLFFLFSFTLSPSSSLPLSSFSSLHSSSSFPPSSSASSHFSLPPSTSSYSPPSSSLSVHVQESRFFLCKQHKKLSQGSVTSSSAAYWVCPIKVNDMSH